MIANVKKISFHLLSFLRNHFLWKVPQKSNARIICRDYTATKTHGTNQVFEIQFEEDVQYFRLLDNCINSRASISRSIGTESVAKLLGLDRIHPKSDLVVFPGWGFGILQKPASGISIMPYPRLKRIEMLTPAFQREINNLNLLDVICYETDHSPNNYNVIVDQSEKVIGISVFDNNGCGTFACRCNVSFSTYKHISPLITSGGLVNRPHLSAETVSCLNRISFWALYKEIHSVLRLIPIICTYIRISNVRRAIHKTVLRNPSFLLKENEWDTDTIKEELGGRYGKTYLVGFVEDCRPLDQ